MKNFKIKANYGNGLTFSTNFLAWNEQEAKEKFSLYYPQYEFVSIKEE